MGREFIRKDQYKECAEVLEYQVGLGYGRVIGIAGPRGIGKTRMLEEFCETTKQKKFFTYIFPSPKRYEAREFVLSLYKELVSKHVPDELPFVSSPLLWSKETWFKIEVATAIFIGIVFGAAVGLISWRQAWGPQVLSGVYSFLAVIYVVLIAALILTYRARRNLKSFLEAKGLSMSSLDLIKESVNRLRKIVYNETISTHVGAEIRGISYGRQRELSIRPYTDRELVDEFKRYVSILSRHYAGVVVCVDELDKITNAEALKDFLTETKDLFYMPETHCVFVLSISEDAVAKYLIGIKDIVDSTFDEVYVLDVASFETSVEIARSCLDDALRKTDAPSQIACAMGGIPRDLERAAHTVNRHLHRMPEPNSDLFNTITTYKLDETIGACRTLRSSIMATVPSEPGPIVQMIDTRLSLLLEAKGHLAIGAAWDSIALAMRDLFVNEIASPDKSSYRQELRSRILELVVASYALGTASRDRKAIHAIINEVKTRKTAPFNMITDTFPALGHLLEKNHQEG